MDVSEQIKSLVQDLTNLEVNTIIKPNMTGRKMPKPRHALIEIAQNYRFKLIDLGISVDDDIPLGCFRGFDMIREKAANGITIMKRKAAESDALLTEEQEADRVMLLRIQRMSDQIKGIFKALQNRNVETWDNEYSRQEIEEQQPPLPLTTDELVMIRKIWNMGMEEIAIQTIIQLDGDVTTRIQPKYATAEHQTLHKLHNQSVGTSLDFWSRLIGLVETFFKVLSKPF